MPAENRDRDIVEHIFRYCEQVETAHQDFGQSRQRFDESNLSECCFNVYPADR